MKDITEEKSKELIEEMPKRMEISLPEEIKRRMDEKDSVINAQMQELRLQRKVTDRLSEAFDALAELRSLQKQIRMRNESYEAFKRRKEEAEKLKKEEVKLEQALPVETIKYTGNKKENEELQKMFKDETE
jgi:hypothetical protein